MTLGGQFFFLLTMWLPRTEFRSLGLVISKCLDPLSHLAGLSSLLFDALVSFGLTKRLEKLFIYINRFTP